MHLFDAEAEAPSFRKKNMDKNEMKKVTIHVVIDRFGVLNIYNK
jgi:hypothetical protein